MNASSPKALANASIQGRVAVKLFLGITDEWALTDEQRCILAGLNSRTSLHNWRNKVAAKENIKLSGDTLERLSYLAGIYKALQILFTDVAQWQDWVKKPNTDFGGQSALERMLAGRVVDLSDVRRYLDSWRGEHYG
jgi:hypothetical protein